MPATLLVVALRPASKTLSSLTGIVVAVAVLWLLLNFVYAPSCGRFACSYVPSWWPQAQADTIAGGCPDGLKGAATDAGWAADRMSSIADEKVTTMLAYDEDGAEHRFVSGRDADEANVVKTLEDMKYPPNPVGQYPAASHVEAKIAYWMRVSGVTHVVAVINNKGGPCSDGDQSCAAIVRVLLPRGSTLEVWWPGQSKPTPLTGGS